MGSQHRNLDQSIWMMSRVAQFILQVHTGNELTALNASENGIRYGLAMLNGERNELATLSAGEKWGEK